MLRPLVRRPLVDVPVALGFLVVGWASSGAADMTDPTFVYTPRDALFVVLLLLATLPYVVRRRWPAAAFAVSLCALAALWVLGYDAGALPLVMLVGAYWVAAARPWPEVAACLGLVLVLFAFLTVADGAPFSRTEWVASLVSLAGAAGLGRSSRLRDELAEARAQATEAETERLAREERLRVSAELHDIVGHSLGVIAVQAGVGRHLLESDPQRAGESLDSIAEVSRTSLGEVRAVVAAMREQRPELHPSPGLTDLPELVETSRSAGLAVTLTMPEDGESVPPQASASAYRIVREALTNVIRHAQATSADVTVERRDGQLVVTVSDDGRPLADPAPAGGLGILGMRERAEALGGTLSTGPAPHGGFMVRGTLPIGPVR